MIQFNKNNYLQRLTFLTGHADVNKKNNISIISLWRPIYINNKFFILGPGINNTGIKFDLLNIFKIFILSKLIGSKNIINFYIKKNKLKNVNIIFIGTIYNYYASPEIFNIVMKESHLNIFVQHGGNYGEYLINDYEDLDKSCSDKFLYWSLEIAGLRQTRFGFLHHLITLKNSLRYLNGFIRLVMYCRIKGLGEISSNLSRCSLSLDFINCLSSNLYEKKVLIHEHPENIEKCMCFDKVNIKYSKKKIGDVAGRNDLIVFDGPSHTFMYYCIENKIPFIILWKDEFYYGMTENFVIFYKKLMDLGVVLYDFDNNIDIDELTRRAVVASEILYMQSGSKYLVEFL